MRVLNGPRQLDIHYLDEEILNSFSDVQIISSEGEFVSTNRLALASCSGLLRNIFAEIEESGCLGSEAEMVISTNIPTESLNAIIDFVTRGSLPVVTGANKTVAKVDPAIVSDLQAFGIDLSMLELEVIELDSKDAQRRAKQRQKKKNEQAVDPSRFVKLDWDILGAALESIGGLDPNNPTAVEVVSAEGESQQIIIQPGDGGTGYLAHIGEVGSDGTTFIEAGPINVSETGTRKRAADDYTATSAKMRRIMLTSKMLPHKREELEAAFAGSSKPRGRPRKSDIGNLGPMIRVIKVEDENGDDSMIDRSGRRQVRKPKRFDGPEGAEDDDVEYDPTEDNKDLTQIRKAKKASLVKGKRPRTSASRAAESSVRWVTCVACGKICKNNYLFKIHLKNFGPYHNNSCALCHAVFDTWEQHIAHLRERHNGEYKYKCGICPEIFETEERQRIHRHEIHTRKNKDKTACDKCGKVVIDYAAHQENYHGTEEHPCPHCGRMFGHQMALKRHIKDNHRQFPCEHCGNIMKNFKKYRLHILSVHTPDNLKPYQCQICVPSRGFATKWNLFEHMNKHTNERPFKCRNCPSAFATTSSRCHHEKSCCGTKNIRVLK